MTELKENVTSLTTFKKITFDKSNGILTFVDVGNDPENLVTYTHDLTKEPLWLQVESDWQFKANYWGASPRRPIHKTIHPFGTTGALGELYFGKSGEDTTIKLDLESGSTPPEKEIKVAHNSTSKFYLGFFVENFGTDDLRNGKIAPGAIPVQAADLYLYINHLSPKFFQLEIGFLQEY